jgi:glycine hydroxymethyltransferase
LSDHKKLYDEVFGLIEKHDTWMQNTINLIASENVSSPAVRSAIVSDFRDRYAEGWPGERVYAGCKYIDEVELICIELAERLFKAEFADVRPVSGVVANLVMYTAVMAPLDRMMALSIAHGGHISHARKNLGGTAGANRCGCKHEADQENACRWEGDQILALRWQCIPIPTSGEGVSRDC